MKRVLCVVLPLLVAGCGADSAFVTTEAEAKEKCLDGIAFSLCCARRISVRQMVDFRLISASYRTQNDRFNGHFDPNKPTCETG